MHFSDPVQTVPIAPESGHLFLGRQLPCENNQGIGFLSSITPPKFEASQLIEYSGAGHLMTIGPTGSGKSRGSAIPALLTHDGPAIVVDVKGELFNTTSRYRREIGQQVYKIDPWSVCGPETDAINPLDLLSLPGVDQAEEANVLAKLLAGPVQNPRDPFWDNTSLALNAGLIAYLGGCLLASNRRLSRARSMLVEDFCYNIAKLLDAGTVRSRLAREEFAIFLQHSSNGTRPSVQSSAQQHFRLLGTDAVRRTMDTSTIDLQDIINGEPMTIYLVIPPHKLDSHGAILRLWLGVFLQALSRRQSMGEKRTLFLVDEAAAIGPMEPLKRAITLLRGYGVQVWTFWQDIAQIQALYPDDWQTLVNNTAVLQLLEPRNRRVAQQYADLVGGLCMEEFLSLAAADQLLYTDITRKAMTCQRIDYLSDRQFIGRYDLNPMFATKAQKKPDGRMGKASACPSNYAR